MPISFRISLRVKDPEPRMSGVGRPSFSTGFEFSLELVLAISDAGSELAPPISIRVLRL